MIKLLLAEQHNIVRKGTRMLLEIDQSISIVDEAVNWQEAVEFIKKGHQIDIVLSDIEMPQPNGIQILKVLKEICPEVKVVILTMHEKDEYVTQAFREGASGYLLKSVNSDELIFALKHVHGGGQYLCAALALKEINTMIHDEHTTHHCEPIIKLTAKESMVLHLIAEGLTSGEMAKKLAMTKRSIEGYRKNLLVKTGTPNSSALIRYALKQGLVP